MQQSESAFGQESLGTGEAGNSAAGAAPSHLPAAAYLPWLEIVAPRGGQAGGSPEEGRAGNGNARMPARSVAHGPDPGSNLGPDLSPDRGSDRGSDLLTRGVSAQAFASLLFAGQTFAGLVHDARNMVTAIDLYCDLLEEPGVLGQAHQHYAGELRLVSAASRRLLDKLARAGSAQTADSASSSLASEVTESSAGLRLMPPSFSTSATPPAPALTGAAARAALTSPHPKRPDRLRAFAFSQPVESLAEELHSNRNLLSAMAGHGVTVGLSIHGGDRPLEMTREDLTRVLVNLARNAGEAMPGGGHLEIELEETAKSMTLAFTDSGPGIPPTALETVFTPGYTTQPSHDPEQGDSVPGPQPAQWPAQHRGLGLAIVRSIAAASGGTVWAANRHDSGGDVVGAILTLEFPLAAPS